MHGGRPVLQGRRAGRIGLDDCRSGLQARMAQAVRDVRVSISGDPKRARSTGARCAYAWCCAAARMPRALSNIYCLSQTHFDEAVILMARQWEQANRRS